ncbi:MAG TPA: antitoxin family protein [Bryobacteraceae bacterium]|nr:antitoxin family protein [Bryobacteraceae bacterium]
MNQQVEAVYEHGVLRPLQPLTLIESQRVQLTISDSETESHRRDTEFLDRVKAEVAAMAHVPSLEDVQRLMSKIPGSLTEDFSAEREE